MIEAPDATLEAPLALARLVEKRWHERGAVSPQELDLAESYMVEFRRADIGSMMQRTHAVALGLGHEFDAALDLVTDLPEAKDNTTALNRVVFLLTERADDSTFLRRILSMSQTQSQHLTTDAAIAVANRLAGLGFSRQAHALAKRPQDSLRRGERARLRAKAALLVQRPHQAMLELVDDPSDEAGLLRAEALIAAGDFAAAGDLKRESDHMDEANRLFWLADLPEQADSADGAKFSRVIQTTQTLSSAPTRTPEKPLADAKELLLDSADTRERVSELLSTVQQN